MLQRVVGRLGRNQSGAVAPGRKRPGITAHWLTAHLGLCPLLFLAWPAAATAQMERPVPSAEYYYAFTPYFEGDYAKAVRSFQSASKGAIRSPLGPWVDSVCYHAMAGECLLQMGELARALEQYDSAVKLAMSYPDWLLSVKFPDQVGAAARRGVPWGVSARNAQLARVPDQMLTFQGRLDNQDVIKRGGVVAAPEFHPVNVKEIVRCTALAIRRRRELLGPLGPHDPLTAQLVATLSRRPAPPNHWSQAWISCELGLAGATAGRPEATAELMKSLVLAGQFDYDLTAMGLLELGKLAFAQGHYKEAATFFLEATFPAAAFDQFDVLEEAFRWGLVTHLVSGQAAPYPPLLPAVQWSRRGTRALGASLVLLAAENAAALGQTADAFKLLSDSRRLAGVREMGAGTFGARFYYQTALVNFQRGDVASGGTALATALRFQKATSRWLFHLGLVDAAAVSGSVSPRVAEGLYADVLREPTPRDWTVDPMDTLAVVSTPRQAMLSRWFRIALDRKEDDKALEISDRIRRDRFHTTLALGGRLVALRWILEAPATVLSPAAQLQRQDLTNRFPGYARLAAEAAELRKQLDALPLASDQADQTRQRLQLLDRLTEVCTKQEVILNELALRRESSEFVFPPQRTLKEIQERMPEGQLLLDYVVADRLVVAFVVSKEKHAFWVVESPPTVFKALVELLKQWGITEKRIGLDAEMLTSVKWKETAATLLEELTNRNKPEMWDAYREVVIVPDGILWYVPFEALPVGNTPDAKPLAAKVRLRYVPTAGLANGALAGRKPSARTAVVTGKLYLGQDEQLGADAFAGIKRVLPDAQRFAEALPAPSHVFGATCDRVVVLCDLEQKGRGPYDWSPLHLDRGKAGSTLETWLGLPWQGPAELVLPGFHTQAETGVKRGANGAEVFLSACGLMAAGARSIVLSRWPVSGQSTYDLVREYVQELPHVTAAEAWQRSVEVLRGSALDLEHEPRVTRAGAAPEMKADHPFFWAGYMVIDSGSKPLAETAR
jgi:tetratricopeptide (TPR) repeat protein